MTFSVAGATSSALPVMYKATFGIAPLEIIGS